MPNPNVGLGAAFMGLAPARADTDAYDDYPNIYTCRMYRLLWNHMHSALHAAYDAYAIQGITKNEFGEILRAQLNDLNQNYSKYTIDGWTPSSTAMVYFMKKMSSAILWNELYEKVTPYGIWSLMHCASGCYENPAFAVNATFCGCDGYRPAVVYGNTMDTSPLSCVCRAGYYGSLSGNNAGACSTCPAPGTSTPGANTAISDCFIDINTSDTDNTGTFVWADKCPYKA